MLFNSFTFIFVFLPVTLCGFFMIGKQGHHRVATAWLVGASLIFYGWWNPAYLGLILGSILVNYAFGVALSRHDVDISKKALLAAGVTLNLALLGYFKYANFFVNEINNLFSADINLKKIILPLAISFFTFQQIAYLVDSYKGETREYNFLHYCLFVSFFPQLIAGPIVHHKEMLPQFAKDFIYKLNYKNLAIGLTIFSIGLFKKVVLADGVSIYATTVFNAAQSGTILSFMEAWVGALAYTFQLYFDFSGYSDMAIGIARMFGILLPLNFNSPYKAGNIIEFWRRWHITLSRFLRDYLYIPLGGNRQGEFRRYINLMITMTLGGLWHGAGWTFIVWGVLHGVYLVINNIWHKVLKFFKLNPKSAPFIYKAAMRVVTFVAVVYGWVFFRAESFDSAMNMIRSMSGVYGVSLPERLAGQLGSLEPTLVAKGVVFEGMFFNGIIGYGMNALKWVGLLWFVSWVAPNTQQIMMQYKPAYETYKGEIREWHQKWLKWQPSVFYAVFTTVLFYWAVISIFKPSEFLYFNF